jgi:membrane-associated phospholipid phosphatase
MAVDFGHTLDTVSVSAAALVGGAILFAAVVRKQAGLAVAAAAVIAGANATTQALKAVLQRPEMLGVKSPLGAGNFFPSGHATLAMSLALAALLVVPTRARGVVALVGALFAASVGVATLTIGWHRPSDVAAGFAVAMAWAASAAWARKGKLLSSGPPARAASVFVATGSALFALTFAGVIVLAIARRPSAAYAGGVVAIAGSALVLVGLLLLALPRRTLGPPS